MEILKTIIANIFLVASCFSFTEIFKQVDTSSIVGATFYSAISTDSSNTMFISIYQDGHYAINKYFVVAGALQYSGQFLIQSVLGPDVPQIDILYAYQNQTKILAYSSVTSQLITINAATLIPISSCTLVPHVKQFLWSAARNRLYFTSALGTFGRFQDASAQNFAHVSLFYRPNCRLHMSISPNQIFMAVSYDNFYLIVIYNLVQQILFQVPIMVMTYAHSWQSNEMLYVAVQSGQINTYNLTSGLALSYYYQLDFPMVVTGFLIRPKLNGENQYILIGTNNDVSNLELIFLSYDFTTNSLTGLKKIGIINDFVKININQKDPQHIIQICSSSVTLLKPQQTCPNNQLYDLTTYKCIASTNNLITQVESYLNSQQKKSYTQVIQNTLNSRIVQTLNYLPGNRKLIQPLFAFFVNFDDLQLYIYHQKQFNFVLTHFLQSIQNLQTQKWNTISFQNIWEKSGVNTVKLKDIFNSKQNFTSWKFYQVQGNSSGFVVNTLNLFLSNIFLIIFMFISLRILFYLLMQHRISKVFRPFSFWPYLCFMLIDGNLQYLSFLFACQVYHFFSPNFLNKLGQIFMIVVIFSLILFVTCSFLLLKQFYGTLAKYFFQNTKVLFSASIYLSLQLGLRNLLLGIAHSIPNQSYSLFLLLTIQTAFLFYSVYFFKTRGFFQNSTRVSINLLAALLRIFLIMTLVIDYRGFVYNEQDQLSMLIERCHLVFVYSYLMLSFFSFGYQIFLTGSEVVSFFHCQKKQQTQNQKKQSKIILPDIKVQKNNNLRLSKSEQPSKVQENQKKFELQNVFQNCFFVQQIQKDKKNNQKQEISKPYKRFLRRFKKGLNEKKCLKFAQKQNQVLQIAFEHQNI